MKKSLVISNVLLGLLLGLSLQSLAQVTPDQRGPGGACGQDEGQRHEEMRRIAIEAERATLERVRADMRAEGTAGAIALGHSSEDCLAKATERAHARSHQAIQNCVQQTTHFRNCEVTQSRVTQQPFRISPAQAEGHVDERDLADGTCRQRAQDRAVQNALSQCQSRYGYPCKIVSGPTASSYEVVWRKRYVLFGPKDTHMICRSQAQALPDSANQIQCGVEIIARVRL